MLNIKLKLTKLKVKSVDGLYEWKDIGGDISGNTTLQAALDKKMDKDEIPSLEGYATEEWVTNQGYLTEHQDLSTYAKKTDIPSLEGYATKTDLSTKADKEHTHLLKDITDYVAPNLSIYATKEEIPSLEGYATEEWVTSKKYLTSHQSLEGYATEQWVTNQGYLTTHQSLEDYYTKTEVDTKLKAISGYTPTDLSKYYTKEESDGKYALKTSIPSLEGYATEKWVTNQGYLTSHQSLADYATKEQLSTKADKEHTHLLKDITDYVAPNLSIYATKEEIPSLNGYATEEWVTSKKYLTSHQSLTDYAKKTELKTINGSSLIGSGDIKIEGGCNGVQKWEGTRAAYNALSAYDDNTLYVITDEDVEYATQQWVTDKGYLTKHQSLADYAKKTDIPNMEGYATKTDVDAKQDKLTNTETLTFLMDDGTSVEKTIYLK